mmetsp:Transcript_44564/g.138664  ORF Transcript_44564/g.138664 Transcript_44564/m.138664 type:complete len:170 (+) Transcript_44564:3-512(+)
MGRALAAALGPALRARGLSLGRDAVLILSNDCCHYGAAFQFEPHGSDAAGHRRQVQIDEDICKECLTGTMSPEKVDEFRRRTFNPDPERRREVDSLWCGVHPIAVGVHALLHLNPAGVQGRVLGLSNSVDCAPLAWPSPPPGLTCPPPSFHHWVGHLAAAYYPATDPAP